MVEFPVEALPSELLVDTNGAGDAFVGGFLAQILLNKSLEEAVRGTDYHPKIGMHIPQRVQLCLIRALLVSEMNSRYTIRSVKSHLIVLELVKIQLAVRIFNPKNMRTNLNTRLQYMNRKCNKEYMCICIVLKRRKPNKSQAYQ